MACLLARQEGSKQKPSKDDRYRQLNMTRNCPRGQMVLTREADPIFFDDALSSANPKSGAYTKYGSVDSNIVDYVNRDELDKDNTRTIKKTRKARPRTPLPPPFPQDCLPGLEAGTINEPLPSAPLMANMGTWGEEGTQGEDQEDLKWRTRYKCG
jgi:hypothetical protein